LDIYLWGEKGKSGKSTGVGKEGFGVEKQKKVRSGKKWAKCRRLLHGQSQPWPTKREKKGGQKKNWKGKSGTNHRNKWITRAGRKSGKKTGGQKSDFPKSVKK